VTLRLAGWLLLAATLASAGGWAGYRSRDHLLVSLSIQNGILVNLIQKCMIYQKLSKNLIKE
jgi:hypothetical protein